MTCKSHCHYKEEKILGSGGCFLSLPGPAETCPEHLPLTELNPAPLDPELKAKFKEIDQ